MPTGWRRALVPVALALIAGEPAAAADLSAGLAKCAAVGDPTQRLSCYDGIARAPQAATAAPKDLGAEQLPRNAQSAAAPEEDSLTADVGEILFTPLGRFVLTLENGQTWRQLDADGVRLTPAASLAHASVTISRGAFGSYNLTFRGQNTLFKVRRVK